MSNSLMIGRVFCNNSDSTLLLVGSFFQCLTALWLAEFFVTTVTELSYWLAQFFQCLTVLCLAAIFENKLEYALLLVGSVLSLSQSLMIGSSFSRYSNDDSTLLLVGPVFTMSRMLWLQRFLEIAAIVLSDWFGPVFTMSRMLWLQLFLEIAAIALSYWLTQFLQCLACYWCIRPQLKAVPSRPVGYRQGCTATATISRQFQETPCFPALPEYSHGFPAV